MPPNKRLSQTPGPNPLGIGTSAPRSPIRSGCFTTPTPAQSIHSAQQSTSDPCRKLLRETLAGKRSEKIAKGRCLKANNSGFKVNLGPEAPLPDIMDAARKVLVGRVRGRNYSAAENVGGRGMESFAQRTSGSDGPIKRLVRTSFLSPAICGMDTW